MQYILTQEEYDDLLSDKPEQSQDTKFDLVKPFLDPLDVRSLMDHSIHFAEKEVVFRVKFEDIHPEIINHLKSKGIKL